MNELIVTQIDNCNFHITGTDINLKETLECGQCFRWFKNEEDIWTGVVRNRVIQVKQSEDGFYIYNTNIDDINNIWINYFDLNHDYSNIQQMYSDDLFISTCAKFGSGIRILKQDPIETIISFIISANNNIKRIQGIIERFCTLYGESINYKGKIYYAFPNVNRISDITLEGLQSIRAGFRDKYIYSAITMLLNTPDFTKKIEEMSTNDAKSELMQIKGIGPKVCDCILLFGFSRYEVFPKDVWIKRVVNLVYGNEFDETYFGDNAGIIQQYFFYYGRNNADKLCEFRRVE